MKPTSISNQAPASLLCDEELNLIAFEIGSQCCFDNGSASNMNSEDSTLL